VAVGRPDDAIHLYLELFRQNPRDIEVLAALGQICQAVGRPEEARTFYQRALEIEPWNRELREALQALGSFVGQRI
jgi:tetratricopeptide (TPR) repeat protein